MRDRGVRRNFAHRTLSLLFEQPGGSASLLLGISVQKKSGKFGGLQKELTPMVESWNGADGGMQPSRG